MSGDRRWLVGALLLALLPACSGGGEPASTPPSSTTATPAAEVEEVSLVGVDLKSLTFLDTDLPRRLPSADAVLPALLGDPPGRALMVYNPRDGCFARICTWDDLSLLFFGEDGRWRRLDLGDLGIPEEFLIQDTFGSGELSPNGSKWAGPSARGAIVLDLGTGRWRLVSTPRGTGFGEWVPGRDSILVKHHEVSLHGGRLTRVPYDSWQVGHEPDGTPLSLIRRPDGSTDLIEWQGERSTTRARVSPELSTDLRPSDLRPVGISVTKGQFATTRRAGSATTVWAADSRSGSITGRLHYSTREYHPVFSDRWLDERTIVLTGTPYFLAWRPTEGRVYRLMDSRPAARSGGYWSVHIRAASLPGAPHPSKADGAAPLLDLRLPYNHRGHLHVGALDAVAPMGQLLASGKSVLATDYSWVAGEDVSATWVFRDGDMERLPMLDDAQLRLSHDGERVVALSHPTPSSTRLSVHWLPSGHREAQVDLPLAGRCCGGHDPVNLLGFDPAGRVFFNANGKSRMWDLSDEVVMVTGAAGPITQSGPGGVAAKPGPGPRVLGTLLGDVDGSGVFRQRLLLPTADATEGIVWSPSGTHVAYTAQHGTVIDSLGDRMNGVPLDLGAAVFSHFVGFEDDATLLLMARDAGQNVLLRCKASTPCEVVKELPGANSLDHWTFPSR